MPDRKKYIEVLSKTVKKVKEFNEDTPIKISLECVEDILELLKEQEDLGTELTNAVELIHKKNERIEKLLKEQVTTSTNESRIFHCEKCGYGIDDIFLSDEHNYQIEPHFCPNCGRSVK